MADCTDVELHGWKVFVSALPGSDDVVLEAVTDEVPLHRMRFVFSPTEAIEMAESFRTAAVIATPQSGASVGKDTE